MLPEKPVDLTKHIPVQEPVIRPQVPDTTVEDTTLIEELLREHDAADSPGIARRLGQRARQWWEDEDRPGLLEFHYFYLPAWMAGAIALGGVSVAASDDILDTHFADELASVHVMPHSNKAFQTLEEIAREIGQAAGGHTRK